MSNIIKAGRLAASDLKTVRVVGLEAFSRSRDAGPKPGKHTSVQEAARSIVDEAKAKAESLVSAARGEAEEIISTAYREGYDEGLRQLDAERAALTERIASIESDMESRLEEFWTGIEPQLLKLAVEIAGKIVQHEVDSHQELVLSTIKTGLRQLRDKHEVTIRVNLSDYEFVRSHKDEIGRACDGVRTLEVQDDRRVGQGGCIIESGHGYLDARLETQLKEVERALLEAADDGRDEAGTESSEIPEDSGTPEHYEA